MSFFTRAYVAPEPSFNSLFRLLNDFEGQSRQGCGPAHHGRHIRRQVRTFSPRFDVKENEDNFELFGELPGIERENVRIEFTDPQTIVISGRIERNYTSGTPAAAVEDKASEAVAETSDASDETASQKSHQATVEDDYETIEGNGTEEPTPATTSAEVAQPEQPQEKTVEKPAEPSSKYWVSERSVGEFSRSFSFQTRVEQEGVSANLNNGVLTVVVPKAKKHEARRIDIL